MGHEIQRGDLTAGLERGIAEIGERLVADLLAGDVAAAELNALGSSEVGHDDNARAGSGEVADDLDVRAALLDA